jgi:hypothetical protein
MSSPSAGPETDVTRTITAHRVGGETVGRK